MSRTTKADLEWVLRTIANLPIVEAGEGTTHEEIMCAQALIARDALAGKWAGCSTACHDPSNIGHPDWQPARQEDECAHLLGYCESCKPDGE